MVVNGNLKLSAHLSGMVRVTLNSSAAGKYQAWPDADGTLRITGKAWQLLKNAIKVRGAAFENDMVMMDAEHCILFSDIAQIDCQLA